jgi:hypothetical protein
LIVISVKRRFLKFLRNRVDGNIEE